VDIIAELSEEWLGCDDYDFLRKNCFSFSEVMLEKLGAGPIPAWVSNLAGAGAGASATLLAGATTLLDPSQQAAIAGSEVSVAAAKAGEMDAQYNVCGTAKAKLVDIIETSLSFTWYLSGAAALGPLNTQSHRMDRATKAADSSIGVPAGRRLSNFARHHSTLHRHTTQLSLRQMESSWHSNLESL